MSYESIVGDCRESLRALPSGSVNCVVTSPPYWRLRRYGGGVGELGDEATVHEYVNNLVMVFREVWRVLRKDGTVWVNLGDSHARRSGARTWSGNERKGHGLVGKSNSEAGALNDAVSLPTGFRAKSLMMMPARVAIAMQDDGWILRSDVIYSKPNPMPESAGDRPTRSYEHVFMFAKSQRYHYDAKASRELATSNEMAKTFRGGGVYTNNVALDNSAAKVRKSVGNKPKRLGHEREQVGLAGRWHQMSKSEQCGDRNIRDVWTIANPGFSGEHYATFPIELARRCIVLGCPVGGVVLDPFGGVGTVGVAADATQRNSILMELNPKYAAMSAVRRADAARQTSVFDLPEVIAAPPDSVWVVR